MPISISMTRFLAGSLVLSGLAAHVHGEECKQVTTAPNFDLTTYVSSPWFVHQQAITQYVPESRFYCLRAQYTILDQKTSPWGYTVGVKNEAQNSDGEKFGGDICAYNSDKDDPAKLGVAPCWIPKLFSGSYWVLAYNESEGYALVSGGQPTEPTKDGLCKTGRGINESGLWIFLRQKERDDAIIAKVRDIALGQGLDLSVLKDVKQDGCKYDDDDDEDRVSVEQQGDLEDQEMAQK